MQILLQAVIYTANRGALSLLPPDLPLLTSCLTLSFPASAPEPLIRRTGEDDACLASVRSEDQGWRVSPPEPVAQETVIQASARDQAVRCRQA